MPFRFLEHTADVRVECTAGTFDALLEAAGEALYALALSVRREGAALEREVALCAEGYEETFLRWAQELIFLLECEHFVATRFQFDALSHTEVRAHLRGYACAAEDRAEEVKSATYHELEVAETPGGFVGRIIFDL